MKELQNLVFKFMEREQVTLKQALLQSSLGMCAKTGDVAEIVRGVVYNDYPYSEERKKRNTEHLGEMLFYWLMLASTTGSSPEEIMDQYIASYIQRNKIVKDDELKVMAARDKILERSTIAERGSTQIKQTQSAASSQNNASIVEMLKYIKDKERIR